MAERNCCICQEGERALHEVVFSGEPLGLREPGAFMRDWHVELLEVGENSKIVVIIRGIEGKIDRDAGL